MQRAPGLIVAIAAWLIAIAGMALAGVLLGAKPDFVVMVLASQAAVALPVLILLIRLRPGEIGLGPVGARGLLAGTTIAPLAILISLGIGAATVAFAGQPPADMPVEQAIADLHQRLGLAGLLLCAAVLPGLAEEALFRGVILTSLRKHLSPAAAVLICALLFAATHLSPWRFLPQLALGILLGWLTVRTGSCWPAALAHILHNAVVLILARWAATHASS